MTLLNSLPFADWMRRTFYSGTQPEDFHRSDYLLCILLMLCIIGGVVAVLGLIFTFIDDYYESKVHSTEERTGWIKDKFYGNGFTIVIRQEGALVDEDDRFIALTVGATDYYLFEEEQRIHYNVEIGRNGQDLTYEILTK